MRPIGKTPGREAQLERARSAILALLRRRGAGKSICPSDAARVLAGQGFRSMMPLLRDAAASLVEDQQVVVTRKGQVVDIQTVRGPIRITIRLDEDSLAYFQQLAEETGIPYQTLINLYLKECSASGKRLRLLWRARGAKGAA